MLRQGGAIPAWPRLGQGVSSELLQLQFFRALDRVRLRNSLPPDELLQARAGGLAAFSAMEIVTLDRAVLERAAQPMPNELGSLDAIHLATALLYRERYEPELVMATHDAALAAAARAYGMHVLGA